VWASRWSALLTKGRRLVNQSLRAGVESGKPERQAAESFVRIGLESDDAAFPSSEDLTGGEDELETQDDALGPGLHAEERDAGASERVELLIEVLVFARVRACDPDCDRRRRRNRDVGHVYRLRPRGRAWLGLGFEEML
jgi:hypothetical protein